MNLDAIMDDLEAQLRAESNEMLIGPLGLEKVNKVVVQQVAELSFNLVAPILGLDFVSGFDEISSNWLLVHSAQVAELRFETVPDPELPTLRRRAIRFADFITELERPVAIQYQMPDRRIHSATLTHLEGELLFTDGLRAIGIRAPLNLRLLEVTDKNELQEWRTR